MHIHHTVQQTQRVKEEHVETVVAPEDSSRQLSKGFFSFPFFLFVFTSESLSRCPEEFLHWHSELVIGVVPFKATYQTA